VWAALVAPRAALANVTTPTGFWSSEWQAAHNQPQGTLTLGQIEAALKQLWANYQRAPAPVILSHPYNRIYFGWRRGHRFSRMAASSRELAEHLEALCG
jgi:hypothetical protein